MSSCQELAKHEEKFRQVLQEYETKRKEHEKVRNIISIAFLDLLKNNLIECERSRRSI